MLKKTSERVLTGEWWGQAGLRALRDGELDDCVQRVPKHICRPADDVFSVLRQDGNLQAEAHSHLCRRAEYEQSMPQPAL